MSTEPAPAAQTESRLREKLGIPAEAELVLVFGETSHWDPNWLLTSEQYYRWRIRRILDAAIDELVAQPRRVFSVECLFFLRMYWNACPERRPVVRQLVNAGRLRLTGSGITTPDTVLPDTEAILRDYLLGQEWLRANGMTVEPRLAYLPDCFGHSPALPSLLNALGMDMAGITRIDGMYFVGTDLRPKSAFPLPGSSAAELTELGSQAFIWRAPDGAEVLCHWNAFSYFQGDMLATLGIIRWMGLSFGMPWRTKRMVASRIEQWVAELRPLARTPYLFCPIGCDFNAPIPGLMGLLDRYNRIHYPATGVWAVNAGMDDYLELCACHRDELPVVELDPNPYWMGFYASRPEAKQRSNRIAGKLLWAEQLAVAADLEPERPTAAHAARGAPQRSSVADGLADGDPSAAGTIAGDLAAAWDLLAVSNHHDFITGTAPDRVWQREQLPWLKQAEQQADRALEAALRQQPQRPTRPASTPPRWSLERGELSVESPYYSVTLSERTGGCFTRASRAAGERNLLAGPANDLVAYRDSGGLWRLGHEYRGGYFEEIERASQQPAIIEATERGGLLEVRIETLVAKRHLVRWLWFSADTPLIRLRLVGAAAPRRTITCRFPTALGADSLHMDVPGGVVQRPWRKLHEPTFWPARSFAHVLDESHGAGLALFVGGPASVSLSRPGTLECTALRYAPRELAYAVLPLPSHPASGTDPDEHAFDYALQLTPSGDFRQNRLPMVARSAVGPLPFRPGTPPPHRPDTVVLTGRDDVMVSAVKAAHRGAGFVARLYSFAMAPAEVQLRLAGRPIREAWLCDARERDLQRLPVKRGSVQVPVRRALTTVRLLV